MRSKITTIFIILCTLVVAALAVYASIRLYILRNQGLALNAPRTSTMALDGEISGCKSLAFNFGEVSAVAAAPTPTLTSTPAPTTLPTSLPKPVLASPTPYPALPEAGVSLPTIIGVVVGIFTIIGTFILIMAPI